MLLWPKAGQNITKAGNPNRETGRKEESGRHQQVLEKQDVR